MKSNNSVRQTSARRDTWDTAPISLSGRLEAESLSEHATVECLQVRRRVAHFILGIRGLTGLDERLRRKFRVLLRKGELTRPSGQTIKEECSSILSKLSVKRGLTQAQQTVAELFWGRQIRSRSGLEAYSGFWIGPFCIDLFLPYFAHKSSPEASKCRTRGLAIEVDGGIHLHEIKQKKDNQKEEYFKSLGIPVLRIENEQPLSSDPFFSRLIRQLGDVVSLSSKEMRRTDRILLVELLLSWCSDEKLREIFGPAFLDAVDQTRFNRQKAHSTSRFVPVWEAIAK